MTSTPPSFLFPGVLHSDPARFFFELKDGDDADGADGLRIRHAEYVGLDTPRWTDKGLTRSEL